MTNGTLEEGEIHPACKIAHGFIRTYLQENDGALLIEALASVALSGNRLAEVALETLERLLSKQPVSDRYLMGLAWMLWEMENE